MYLVIGNTPQKVELKDLGDYVYYKQQKIFTEAQYTRSQDLQREIQKGSLTILKKTEEKTGSFEVPSVSITQPAPITNPVIDTTGKLDTLLERIQGLESAVREKNGATIEKAPTAPQPDQSDFIKILTDKISRLEAALSGKGRESDLSTLHSAIKKLEERIDKGSSNNDILKKLDDIANRAPTYVTVSEKPKEETRPEDVYVPSVTVEDSNTHIKLDVRTIDSGDSVSDSLKKLKELKSKSTSA
jgi:hypothetical protein